jgi:hypothetical protein
MQGLWSALQDGTEQSPVCIYSHREEEQAEQCVPELAKSEDIPQSPINKPQTCPEGEWVRDGERDRGMFVA